VAEANPHLRELLYLDWDKLASIYSQIHGGLLQETQETAERLSERRAALGVNLGLLKPEFGGAGSERVSSIETRVLHHDLLVQMEDALAELGASMDIPGDEAIGSAEEARAVVDQTAYLRAEGWAVIEDYQRVDRIAAEWPELARFIQRCVVSGLEETPELKQLRADLEATRSNAARGKQQQRSRVLRDIEERERALDEMIASLAGFEDAPEDWLIEGIRRWIEVFLPGRITLRIYPFEAIPSFQVICNLKRDSFVDADLGNLLFAYGTRPNVRLTVFGLVTAAPRPEGHAFDPMSEFADIPEGHEEEELKGFERGFRELFAALEGMEAFGRFSRYPTVTVYPLAVYRRVPISGQAKEAT
jgi:hypothetical protein